MQKRVVLKALLMLPIGSVWANAFEDFFSAVQRDDLNAVRSLARRGFDLNTLSAEGQHPLFLALRSEADQVAAWLLDQPSTQVEHRNAQGESPLMMAALKGKLGLADRLIQRKAEVNKPGWTPLHYAATHPGPAAVPLTRLLLEHHAYIDAASPNQSTPLMLAAQYGDPAVVSLLLEEGADPMLRNEQGLTAIDFARRAGRAEVADTVAGAVRKRQPAGRW